ncbi:MAG TPA: NnrS family protein [Thiolinea sp.]|nr:NnrS family protein [Thiolinea sp.]
MDTPLPNHLPPRTAFLSRGFRPFFLCAILAAIILGLLWMLAYSFNQPLLHPDYPLSLWHGHEMVFGYSVAVLAGFLLTAVNSRTGVPVASGSMLLTLVLLWLLARFLPLIPGLPLWLPALAESLFLLGLLVLTARPFLVQRTWRQLALPGQAALLLPASLLFHLGLLQVWEPGLPFGLYLGFYLLLGLLLTLGGNVVPHFIENTVRNGFQTRSNRWLDLLGAGVFVVFAMADMVAVTFSHPFAAYLSAILALVLFAIHATRMQGWYHHSLWQHPLLWALYLAYAWIVFGFLLKFLTLAVGVSPWVALHAFGYGGIGLASMGMMARVTLNHTGRHAFAPPAGTGTALALLAAGAVIRVLPAWWLPQYYAVWMLAALLVWVAAFMVLLWVYALPLLLPRIDGNHNSNHA